MKQLDHNARFIIAVSALVLLSVSLYLALHLAAPSDGAHTDYGDRPSIWTREGIALAPIAPASPLRRNDVVIAIDGQSLPDVASALFDLSLARPHFEFGRTVTYTVQRDGRTIDVAVPLGPFPLGAQLAQQWLALALSLLVWALAGFVFVQRPNERAAQVFFLSAVCLASLGLVQGFIGGLGELVRVGSFWMARLLEYGLSCALISATLHLAVIFPRPHLWVTRWQLLVPLIYFVPPAALTGYLALRWPAEANVLTWFGQWSVASDRINAVYFALIVLAMLSNYYAVRHDAVTRQQARWVVLGYAITLTISLALAIVPKVLTGHWLVDRRAASLFLLPVLVSLAIAILRYHLFDIDFYINRVLVHGTLTAFVIGAYSSIVIAFSTFLRIQNNLALSLVATGLIAVVFQLVRERVQRAVNRLMYGERDEPYAVLSRLSHQLEQTLSPDAVLPTIVETVARALKLPYVALALRQDEGMAISAVHGALPVPPSASSGQALVTLSLIYQGETVGELRLAPRAPGEPLTSADQHLLDDLARQAGLAVHAVQQTRHALRLAADLQQSRERIVTAREEERRRLRRDLHDGLGPALASQTLTLDAVARLLRADPDRAEDLLHSLREQSQQAIADIRDLVYGLRPPALDDLGLSGALRQLADRLRQSYPALDIAVQVLDDLPSLPAAVEVAAYRIAQEALTNVVKHTRATECRVTLCLTDESRAALVLEIADNGPGIAPERITGVGLHSMRERAEELGGQLTLERAPEGGTLVVAELPLRLERTNS